jgi:hypothetical protein
MVHPQERAGVSVIDITQIGRGHKIGDNSTWGLDHVRCTICGTEWSGTDGQQCIACIRRVGGNDRRLVTEQAAHERAIDAPWPGGDEPLEDDDTLDGSWEPVDLGPALRGERHPIIPSILARDDGAAMFYRGQFNGIHGDSGTGKSWMCVIAAAQQLAAGEHVVWIDFEDPTEVVIVERLRTNLDVDDDDILERFHYFGPKTEFGPRAVAHIIDLVNEWQASLVVIDSFGEAFGVEALNENDDKDVAPWLRRVVRAIVECEAAPAVVMVDHATKSADNPLYPSGSKRKRAAITGASYLVTAPKPLDKQYGGTLLMTAAKDRHGTWRRGKNAAELVVEILPGGLWSWEFREPKKEAEVADLRLERATKTVAEVLHAAPGLTQNLLLTRLREAGVKGQQSLLLASIEEAIRRGWVEVRKGDRGGHLHFLAPGIEV